MKRHLGITVQISDNRKVWLMEDIWINEEKIEKWGKGVNTLFA
jgi:hypothetical protein